MKHRYTFAEQYVAPIVQYRKDATVRYDDERRVVPGDRLLAVTPDGEPFTRLRAEAVVETRVTHVPRVLDGLGAAHHAQGRRDLLDGLREHYPDADLDDTSRVRVLKFGLVGGA